MSERQYPKLAFPYQLLIEDETARDFCIAFSDEFDSETGLTQFPLLCFIWVKLTAIHDGEFSQIQNADFRKGLTLAHAANPEKFKRQFWYMSRFVSLLLFGLWDVLKQRSAQ